MTNRVFYISVATILNTGTEAHVVTMTDLNFNKFHFLIWANFKYSRNLMALVWTQQNAKTIWIHLSFVFLVNVLVLQLTIHQIANAVRGNAFSHSYFKFRISLHISSLVPLKTYSASCSASIECNSTANLWCPSASTGCNCPNASVPSICDCNSSKLFNVWLKSCL